MSAAFTDKSICSINTNRHICTDALAIHKYISYCAAFTHKSISALTDKSVQMH